MVDQAKTYGDFFDTMEGTECIYAQGFIEEWKALATEEQWAEFRPMPLTRELVLAFVEDMATYFRELIAHTCTDALYAERIAASHAFLHWVHEKAVEFGIEVRLEEIDAAITPTESLVVAGLTKVVPADPNDE